MTANAMQDKQLTQGQASDSPSVPNTANRPARLRKPTLATLKAFVRRNQGRLFIRHISAFDGMIDGLSYSKDRSIVPAVAPETRQYADGTTGAGHPTHDLGIAGVWLVGQSRDYISPIEEPGFTGYHVYNSCGSFDLFTPSR